jgi:hypothetical protein
MTNDDANAVNAVAHKKDDDCVWIDLTDLVEQTAASLSVQEPFLRNKLSFSLHDAMAASQLLDCNMDSCEIPASYYNSACDNNDNGTDKRFVFPRPAPTALVDPFHQLLWDELISRDTILIALEMLVRFEASLCGSSVGESTFTCLYAHAGVLMDMKAQVVPKLLDDFLLSNNINDIGGELIDTNNFFHKFIVLVCAWTLVDATEIARSIILHADIYEEEDFVVNTYDISFASDNEDLPTLRLLEKAIQMAQLKDNSDCQLLVLVLDAMLGFYELISTVVRWRLTTISWTAVTLKYIG